MIKLNTRGADRSPYCAQCPCAKNGAPQKVAPAFGGTGGLCIIGEAPSNEDLNQGFPGLGPSGRVLNMALRKAGADRGYVFITNAILCRRPSNTEDAAKATECCRARLVEDLILAEPTAICALGSTAMWALQLPVTAVAQARGTVQTSPWVPGIPVIGAQHPSTLLHGGAGEMGAGGKQKMNVDAQALFLFADITKAYAISRGDVDPVWRDDIQVVSEAAEVMPALEALFADAYKLGVLGLDLEWTCPGHKSALDALGAGGHLAQITWVGLGCEKWAVSFKWEALLEADAFPYIQQVMEDPALAKLAHNKQADKAVWEAQVGPVKGRWLDTMLMHHAVCPGIDHDLQQVVSQYLCVPPWKVDHARAIREFAEQQKAEGKALKAAEKETIKAAKQAEHEARNLARAAEKATKKAAKQAAHEAKNAAAAAGGQEGAQEEGRGQVDGGPAGSGRGHAGATSGESPPDGIFGHRSHGTKTSRG